MKILQNYKASYTAFENLAIQSIVFDDLQSTEQSTDFEKVREVMHRFKSEYATGRNGITKELTEWLQGLPSILDFPFYYYDQLEWAKQVGIDVSTEEKESIFLESFFIKLARAFVTLNNNL